MRVCVYMCECAFVCVSVCNRVYFFRSRTAGGESPLASPPEEVEESVEVAAAGGRLEEQQRGCATHYKHLTSAAKPRPRPAAPLGELGRAPRPHWPLVFGSISGMWLSEAADGAGRC